MVATRPPTATVASGFSGTVQYMAPEQLDGDPGDHRADIFAFGCVLYEMLAGRKAFEGASAVTVIAAIMSSEPPPIASAAGGASAARPRDEALPREGSRAALAEHRRRHRRAALDCRPSDAPLRAALRRRSARPSRVGRCHSAAAVVLATAAVAMAVLAAAQDAAPRRDLPALRLEISTPPTDDPTMALSPDGTQIAFVANQNRVPMLWVRSLDAVENRALPGTEGASFPFWSPDGRTLGFFADDKLKRIDVAGGRPLVIADAPNGRGGTWNGDGVILFAADVNAPLMRVSTRGGPAESVTQSDTGSGPDHRWPQFLPDGKRFLFSSTLGTADTNGVYLGSLDKTPPVRVLRRRHRPLRRTRQAADDQAGSAAGVQLRRRVRQRARRTSRHRAGLGGGAGRLPSPTPVCSRTAPAPRSAGSWCGSTRQGDVLRAIGEPQTDHIGSPELSADEQSVVVFSQRSGDNDIWVIELARNLARRITDGPAGRRASALGSRRPARRVQLRPLRPAVVQRGRPLDGGNAEPAVRER